MNALTQGGSAEGGCKSLDDAALYLVRSRGRYGQATNAYERGVMAGH